MIPRILWFLLRRWFPLIQFSFTYFHKSLISQFSLHSINSLFIHIATRGSDHIMFTDTMHTTSTDLCWSLNWRFIKLILTNHVSFYIHEIFTHNFVVYTLMVSNFMCMFFGRSLFIATLFLYSLNFKYFDIRIVFDSIVYLSIVLQRTGHNHSRILI